METAMELMELDMQPSNKILSLMQPTYLPWLGYFNLIKNSDIFVIYTTTQLTKRSWQTRNKIKGNDGEVWLTIPIKKTKSRDNLLIKDAEINYESGDWVKKHLNSIRQCYSKSNYFEDIYPIIERVLNQRPKYLIYITVRMLIEFLDLLDINTEIVISDDIDYSGKKDEALISICNELGVDRYMSVMGSMDYILSGDNLFEKNNIELLWHTYEHPIYNQVNGKFISHLGIIDCLFNVGIEETKKLL